MLRGILVGAAIALVDVLRPTIPTDIFWTFFHSAWNTTFKLLFLGSSAYTIYLMTTELKATQDPTIDTFKIEYLLGGSAVIAILFPYEYKMSEVRHHVLPLLLP